MGDNGGNSENSDNRKAIGRLGERAALDYLCENHYEIIAQNWRCRVGEIDLIALKEQTIIFIEVRTRKYGKQFGSPAESIDYRKQQKLRQVAQVYLHLNGQNNATIRFDVIAIHLNTNNTVKQFEHFEAAF